MERTIPGVQVYSLAKKLQEHHIPTNLKKEVNVVKENEKISVGEFYCGLNYSEGFLIDKEYWKILREAFVNTGYRVNEKKKINWRNLFGDIFWGGVLVSTIASFTYFGIIENKIRELKKEVYEIVNENNNDSVQIEEWNNLGKKLGLVENDKTMYAKDIQEKINHIQWFGKEVSGLEKYVNEHKKENEKRNSI